MKDPKVNLADRSGVIVPDQSILLNPGEMGATIELVVREGFNDPTGKIIRHIGPKRSESFTKQFMDLLSMMFNNQSDWTSPTVITDTSNHAIPLGNTQYAFDMNAAITSVLYGIIVGTGVTAVDISDYKIETIIAHGVGAGQLQYSAHTFGAPASDATTSQFTVTRNFANASGGAITVNEVALYTRNTKNDISNPFYFCIIRDNIAGGISVGNGQTLTVNYRPQAVI